MTGLFALLRPIYIILGSLSLICGMLVCFAYLKSVFRPTRAAENMKPEEKQLWVFITSMSVCDAVLSLKFLLPAIFNHLGETPDSADCLMESLIGQFFAIAGVMWYATVVVCLITEIMGRGPKITVMRVTAPVVVWGYSIVVTVFVWVMGGFGPSADGTCWIIPGNWFRLTFFLPMWISLMLGFVLLVCALCNCNALGRRLPCYSLTRSILFMSAFIFVWVWVVVLRVYEAVRPGEEPPEQLILLHACGVSSQGLVNFLLWVTSPSLAAVLTPPAFCKRLNKCCGDDRSLPLFQERVLIHEPNSLSVRTDMPTYGDCRFQPDNRASFQTELTPRTHEELLLLAGDNIDFPPNIADYRGLTD